MLSAQNSRKILQVDEHVRFRGFNLIHESPPQLYIDDYTLMREVSDVLKMREGDHCIVGVNLMHKLFRWSDAACNFLTSYHIMPFYHHFVLIDSVTSLSSVGEPLNACGQPCRVLEFSDTISGVWRKIVADGHSPPTLLRNAATYLRSPAKLHTPPLSDYLPLDGRGVFVVAEELSAEDRERTAAAARALAEQARSGRRPAYRVFSSNCEHLAWSVDTTSRRWISPQVCGTRARASFPLTPHPLSSHRTPSAHAAPPQLTPHPLSSRRTPSVHAAPPQLPPHPLSSHCGPFFSGATQFVEARAAGIAGPLPRVALRPPRDAPLSHVDSHLRGYLLPPPLDRACRRPDTGHPRAHMRQPQGPSGARIARAARLRLPDGGGGLAGVLRDGPQRRVCVHDAAPCVGHGMLPARVQPLDVLALPRAIPVLECADRPLPAAPGFGRRRARGPFRRCARQCDARGGRRRAARRCRCG